MKEEETKEKLNSQHWIVKGTHETEIVQYNVEMTLRITKNP